MTGSLPLKQPELRAFISLSDGIALPEYFEGVPHHQNESTLLDFLNACPDIAAHAYKIPIGAQKGKNDELAVVTDF